MVAAIFGAPPAMEDRKKKVTYGRQARLPKRSVPAKAVETPSPTQQSPLKQSAHGALFSRAQRKPTVDSMDDFDVPSSDSEGDTAKRTKRVLTTTAIKGDGRLSANGASRSARSVTAKSAERDAPAKPATTANSIKNTTEGSDCAGAGAQVLPQKRKRAGGQEPSKKVVAPKTYGRSTHKAPIASSRSSKVIQRVSDHTEHSVPRGLLKEGVSAPARLAGMVDETMLDEDSLQMPVPMRIPRAGTQKSPPRSSTRPPLVKSTSSITPKQSKLWDQLLEPGIDASAEESPHKKRTPEMAMQRADSKDLHEANMTHPRQISPPLKPEGRMRLADRLKQDSQKNDDVEDSSDEDDSDDVSEVLPAAMTSQLTSSVSQGASGPRPTYAQNRSYLQELNIEDSLLVPLIDVAPKNTSKRANQKSLDLESDDEPTQGIRSVHELRAAGSKKRFLDDVEILLEDVKDRSRLGWSKRRSALMELSRKLESLDFAQRFADNDFATAVVKACETVKVPDVVSDSILFVVLAQLVDLELPRHTIDELKTAISWLVGTSATTDNRRIVSIAKDRHNNMSKVSAESYVEFMTSLGEMSFWRSSKPQTITLDILALRALEALLMKLRKSGQMQPLLGTAASIEGVVSHIALPQSDHDFLLKRNLALSLLEAESLSIAVSPASASKCWSAAALKSLICFLSGLLSNPAPLSSDLTLSLRLLLNLTNNQPSNCALFAPTAKASGVLLKHIGSVFAAQRGLAGIDNATLDTLLLSLGLTINLAEHSDAVRRSALPSKDSDALGSLVHTFLRGREASNQADSLEESRGNVAYGYLAVLLGNLCLNDKVKMAVSKQMGGLEALVGAVEEFLGYHRRIDEGQEGWEGFTERLGMVLEKLRF